MNTPRFLIPGFALAALASTAIAQQVADTVVHDANNDQMVLLTDLDGDGKYTSVGEQRILERDASNYEPYGAAARFDSVAAGRRQVAFWVETDRVFPNPPPPYNSRLQVARDLNGNGTFDAFEISSFRDLPLLDGPALTQGIGLGADDSVWFSSDIFPTQAGWLNGVYRTRDLNGDGDANDAGEFDVMVDGVAGMHPVTTNSGTVSIESDSFRQMTNHGNGTVVFNNFDHSALFRFEDLNNDGDVIDANESLVWLNASGENPSLDWNPDFATAVAGSDPRSIVVDPLGPSNGWLEKIATLNEGGKEIVYAACGSSSSSSFGTNQFGEPIHGLIFRCEDKNADGDANDAGETTTFYNGNGVGTSGPLFIDKIVGLGAEAGALYVCEFNPGAGNSVYVMRDLNADGDAMDAGEAQLMWNTNQNATDPPFPCNPPMPPQGCGPFINSMDAFPAGSFGPCSSCGAFCTAKAGLACGVPSIRSEGSASATATSGFVVRASPARTNRLGVLLYNTGAQVPSVPFQGGELCVFPGGLRRGGPTNSLGSLGCDGEFFLDINTFGRGLWVVPPSGAIPSNNAAAFLSMAGTTVYCEFWGRDSVATGSFVSNALSFVIGP